jgi:hypothetical protein
MEESPLPTPPSPYAPPAAHLRAAEPGPLLVEAWRRLVEKHWLLLGTYLTIMAPVELIVISSGLASIEPFVMPDPFAWLPLIRQFPIEPFVELTFGSLATAAVIHAAARDHAAITVRQALLRGVRSWPKVFVARILAALATVAGLLACVLPFFFFMLALALVDYVAVLEGKSGIAALKRSYELTRDRLLYVLGTILLAFALATVVVLALAAAGDLLIWLDPRFDHPLLDWLLDVADGASDVFVIVFLQCVYERLARQPSSAEGLEAA